MIIKPPPNLFDDRVIHAIQSSGVEIDPKDYLVHRQAPTCKLNHGDSGLFDGYQNLKPASSTRVVFLDFEATELDPDNATAIEIGMVDANVDITDGNCQIISINNVYNRFNDPGFDLQPIITEVTGLTNEDLLGHQFDESEIARFITNNYDSPLPTMIAHNSSYDSKIFERTFPRLAGLKWACSISDCKWGDDNVPSRGQESLLSMHGYTYTAHRAKDDALALCWLLHLRPDRLRDLVDRAEKQPVIVAANQLPFSGKDELKSRKEARYLWDPNAKLWSAIVRDGDDTQREMDYLTDLYARHGSPSFASVKPLPIKPLGALLNYSLDNRTTCDTEESYGYDLFPMPHKL